MSNTASRVMFNYRSATANLSVLTEDELLQCIRYEAQAQRGKRRQNLLKRVHARYCKLRRERELEALFNDDKVIIG